MRNEDEHLKVSHQFTDFQKGRSCVLATVVSDIKLPNNFGRVFQDKVGVSAFTPVPFYSWKGAGHLPEE